MGSFANMDKKADEVKAMSATERREYYKRKEEAQKKGAVVEAQSVEVIPPKKDGSGGGFNVNLPAPINALNVSPVVNIKMPDPAENAESRWWGVGREAVETVKSMMLGAAFYALALAMMDRF